MHELKDFAETLAKKELTRRQFLTVVGSSFISMISGFQLLQLLNTPANQDDTLATSNKEVFGEREYGHPGSEEFKRRTARTQTKRFDEDVFG